MDKGMDGWMDGWLDGWMDGWLDGWMKGFLQPTYPIGCFISQSQVSWQAASVSF
jgi:hypothetical protein